MTIHGNHFGLALDTPITGDNIVNRRNGHTSPLILQCQNCNRQVEIPGREFRITVSELPVTEQETRKNR